MRTKVIKQEDGFGCGVACTAALLDITYQQALKLFDMDGSQAKNQGFICNEICMVLNEFDKNYGYKYVKNRLRKKIYKLGTIVFIKKSKKYPAGHYLLRTEDGWMDPWINFREDHNIRNADAGIRKKLPSKAIYFIQENSS